jgi:hypothetical protein
MWWYTSVIPATLNLDLEDYSLRPAGENVIGTLKTNWAWWHLPKISSTPWKTKVGGSWSLASTDKNTRPSLNSELKAKGCGHGSSSSKHKALSLNPQYHQKKNGKVKINV